MIFISFLISAHPAYGQLYELSMLGALNESISGTSGNVNNIEESEAREIDENNDSPQNRMQYNWENSYTSKEVNASASEQFAVRLQEMQHQIYSIVENLKQKFV